MVAVYPGCIGWCCKAFGVVHASTDDWHIADDVDGYSCRLKATNAGCAADADAVAGNAALPQAPLQQPAAPHLLLLWDDGKKPR